MFWASAFILGFVGSLHCGAMCGPIVLAFTIGNNGNKISFVLKQLAYNSGRILTYLIIGSIIGLIGKGLAFIDFQQNLSIFSGGLILLLYFTPKVSKKFNILNGFIIRFTGVLKKSIGPFFKSQSIVSKFMIGFINGFLPCGLVYIAAAGAVATGEPLNAALFMLFFGLGTIPMLFTISISHAFFSSKIKLNSSRIIPLFVATISLLFILRGMNLGIPYVSPEVVQEGSSVGITNCDIKPE